MSTEKGEHSCKSYQVMLSLQNGDEQLKAFRIIFSKFLSSISMVALFISLLLCTNLFAVVKGRSVKKGEWSTTVRINYKGSSKRCTGTLVSANTVLTAAHCLVRVDGNNLIVRDGVKVFVESGVQSKYYNNIRAIKFNYWYLEDVRNNSFKTIDLRSNYDIGYIVLEDKVESVDSYPSINFLLPESNSLEKYYVCGYGLSFRDKRYFLGNSTFRSIKTNLKNDQKTKHVGVTLINFNSYLNSLETTEENFSKSIKEQLKSYVKYGQRFFAQTAPGDSGSSLQTLSKEVVGVANLGKWKLKKGYWAGGMTLTRNITSSTFAPLYIEENKVFLETVFESGGSFKVSNE